MGYADNRPPALTAYNHNRAHQPAYDGRRPSSSMNHTHQPAGYSGSVPRPSTELFTLPRPWNLPPVKLPSILFTSYGIPGVSLNALLKRETKLDNSREKIFEPFGHRQASIAIHVRLTKLLNASYLKAFLVAGIPRNEESYGAEGI